MPYAQDELASLMLDFKAHEIPPSVYHHTEWHITRPATPAPADWLHLNREPFPDPPDFLSFCTSRACTPRSSCTRRTASIPTRRRTRNARRLGIDPRGEPVPHDLIDLAFAAAY